MDLGEETGEEMEEKVRRWMKAEEGMGLLSSVREGDCLGGDLAELGDGKTVEVMVELRGGMVKKKSKRNPWITPSQSSSGSEPEMVRTEMGCSSAERDGEKLQDVLERKVNKALEEGRGVLDR